MSDPQQQMVRDSMTGFGYGYGEAATRVLDIAREYRKAGDGATFDLLLSVYDRLRAEESEVHAKEQARWDDIVARSKS